MFGFLKILLRNGLVTLKEFNMSLLELSPTQSTPITHNYMREIGWEESGCISIFSTMWCLQIITTLTDPFNGQQMTKTINSQLRIYLQCWENTKTLVVNHWISKYVNKDFDIPFTLKNTWDNCIEKHINKVNEIITDFSHTNIDDIEGFETAIGALDIMLHEQGISIYKVESDKINKINKKI